MLAATLARLYLGALFASQDFYPGFIDYYVEFHAAFHPPVNSKGNCSGVWNEMLPDLVQGANNPY
jgi:hypothetical protein